MKIGKIDFKNGLFLAPMAGVTDVGFRAIARFFGADMTYTEMVSAKGLIYGKERSLKTPLNPIFVKKYPEIAGNKTAWLLINDEIENKKGVQIFGSDTKFMSKACQNELLQKFDVIDINMGCPAPKIVKNGEGSALMGTIDRAREIISDCVKSTETPITVKFRKGFKESNAVEFAQMCEEAGASAITVHARFTGQGYSGNLDYDVVRSVKKSVKIPVIGSGDVKDFESYEKMLATGVDGVMVGRASMGNQIIFKKLTEFITKKEIPLIDFIKKSDFFYDILTNEDFDNLRKNENYIKYICAKKHIAILRQYYAEEYLVKYMRKHMLWYAGGIKNRLDLKQKIALSDDLDQSLIWLKEALR